MAYRRFVRFYGKFILFRDASLAKLRVHWLVKESIDRPDMWLSERGWNSVADRFTIGANPQLAWLKPDLVNVCTSPGFIDTTLRRKLVRHLDAATSTHAEKL